MAVTINDIVKKVNLSKSTVSKALNGYPDIAPETRQRVTEVALQLGYQPSAAAQSLSLGRTNRFGLFLNTSIGYVLDYLHGVIPGATQQANALDKHLLVYTTLDDNPDKLFDVFGSREIDGVILFSSYYPEHMLQRLFDEKYPFVVMGKQIDDPRVSYIVPDYYDGSRQGMEHLLAQGHQRIAFMTRPELGITSEVRLKGYQDALTEAGIPIDPALIVETRIEPDGGVAPTEHLLDLADPPTAIFAFHDLLAIDAIGVIQRRGLRVPEDIAVMGFDGLRVGQMVTPQITTIQQPLEQIGEQVVKALHQITDGPDAAPVRSKVPVHLSIRHST